MQYPNLERNVRKRMVYLNGLPEVIRPLREDLECLAGLLLLVGVLALVWWWL